MSTEFIVRQEEDRIEGRRPLLVFAAAIVIVVVSLAGAGLLLHAAGGAETSPAGPTAPRQIGTIERTLVRDTERGIDLRRKQQLGLEGWAWVDRDAGVAQIPIDVAIELTVHASAPDATNATNAINATDGGR